MNDKIIIRLAKVGDENKIAQMIKEGFERGFFIYTGSNSIPDKTKIKKMRDSFKRTSDMFCFIAIDKLNGKVVGSMTSHFKKTGRLRHRIDMGWSVHPDYSGKGIATRLLKSSLDEAKKRGFKRAEAEAAVENIASWKLAKKLGFKVEGIKKKALLTDDGRYIDTYILGRLL